MSHVSTIPAEVRDLDGLRAACRRMGWEFREGQKSYAWYGRYVGDTQLPEHLRGLTNEELGRCDHAIRVPGASYEVGVVEKADGSGYELRWDYYSAGGLIQKLGGESAPVLLQAYALGCAQIDLEAQGYQVTEQVLADGTVRLSAVGY
jgi:hypothetical protein